MAVRLGAGAGGRGRNRGRGCEGLVARRGAAPRREARRVTTFNPLSSGPRAPLRHTSHLNLTPHLFTTHTHTHTSHLLTRSAATLATPSPNYFPHLTKVAPSGASQMRVAGAALRGRDRAPHSSVSDPEALSLRATLRAAPTIAAPTPASVEAACVDSAFYADAYSRHTSWSDPATLLSSERGRAPCAPGVVVSEGGPAVSTPDVPHPLRHSLTEPTYADAVRTRLS